MKRAELIAVAALGLAALAHPAFAQNAPAPAAPAAEPAAAAAEAEALPHYPLKSPPLQRWSFAGIFGTFDTAQVQRGFQVYKEVCANCHSLNRVAFRHLGLEGGPHFTDDEVKALAASYQVNDGPNDEGEMFQRPGRPYDHLPSPFPNVQAAAAANGGAAPPDLSLMAKARGAPRGVLWATVDFFTGYQEGGPDYIHALLTGFSDPPAGVTVPEGTYYNPYFMAAPSLKMPPPLSDGQVSYSDGSPQTVDQYATDVAAFLMWAAEPHLVERKRIGFMVGVFVLVFCGLMYLTKKRVWAGVAH
jgi:ubiquinol-cytochrome c reductase cytochrome c1 subunit